MSMHAEISAPVVEVRDLRIELAATGADIVDEATISIAAGEVLGLVGESGCGKTTIGLSLLGHSRGGARVAGGSIRIAGHELTAMDEDEVRALRGGVVAYIPQDPPTSLNPALRVGPQLREVLDLHAAEWTQDERDVRLREVLREVLLPDDEAFLRRFPHQLSGGQQQRVAIAMAFACRPAVIVCDEPTTGLDVTTQARVLETVRELCRVHDVAALYVSHDLAVVSRLADRVAVMYAGRVVEEGSRARLFASPAHPYTRRLVLAVPDADGDRPPVGIAGHAPTPGHRPQGCFFAPRCPLALPVCRTEFPPVTEVAPGHGVRCHRAGEDVAVAPRVLGDPAPARDGAEPILAVRRVDAFHGDTQVLHDVTFEVARGECLALVGESGSGKTTAARCVAGLHAASTGEMLLDGQPLAQAARRRSTEQRRRIQYVFQNPYASLNPRRTVGQSLCVPLRLFHDVPRARTGARVAELLDRVSLSASTAQRFPDELSGGERQRVAIARALAADPAVLICDEVTSALDVSVQATVVELLRRLQREMGLGMVFITHNLALIRTLADRIAVMTDGRIVETAPVATVFARPEADYTRRLLANTPTLHAGVPAA